MVLVCIVKNCKNAKSATKEENCKLYRIPLDLSRSNKWLINCGRHDLSAKSVDNLYNNFRVCMNHFKGSMFSNPEKNRLLVSAVPTEFDMHATTSSSTDFSDSTIVDHQSVRLKSSPPSMLLPNSTLKELKIRPSSPATSTDTIKDLHINDPRKERLRVQEISELISKCSELVKQEEKLIPNSSEPFPRVPENCAPLSSNTRYFQCYSYPLIDHCYSTAPTKSITLDDCDTISLDSDTSKKYQRRLSTGRPAKLPTLKKQSEIKSISFQDLNTLDICLPPNWQKYFSRDKKNFAFSEIIFIQKGDTVNSFIRKNIILNECLSINCSILGKSISTDKLVNSNSNVETKEQLEKLLKEVASLRICRGLNLISSKKFDSFFSVNDNVVFDTMQTKRLFECPYVIQNGLRCTHCTKTIKKVNQKRNRSSSKKNFLNNYNKDQKQLFVCYTNKLPFCKKKNQKTNNHAD